jgi:hypothetical protein
LDRARTLRLDFNALCALRKETGQNPLSPEFWADFDDVLKLRATLWAALIHEDPSLTVAQVGAVIDMTRLAEIANALATAVSAAMPSKKLPEVSS